MALGLTSEQSFFQKITHLNWGLVAIITGCNGGHSLPVFRRGWVVGSLGHAACDPFWFLHWRDAVRCID